MRIPSNQIEAVARGMCEELGLDPDALATYPQERDMSPQNYVQKKVYIDWPGPNKYCQEPYVIEPLYDGPQWRMFRRDAAIHLAGWYAVNKYMLTKA